MRLSTIRDPFYSRTQRLTVIPIDLGASHRLATFVTLVLFTGITFVLCMLVGCAAGKSDDGSYNRTQNATSSSNQAGCKVTDARYPTTASDFADARLLYGHRGFLDVYQNVKHLGRDIVYAEGVPIHPIACGTIRHYSSASGYGTLAAVIEHELTAPITVVNGDGESAQVTRFMSIYGHLRDSEDADGTKILTWKVGDTIGPDDIVGYIQSDALNGDGPEHLHTGIRLQSMSQAQIDDPSAWFRGNDTAGEGLYKKYYTDPATFIPQILGDTSTGDEQDAAADQTNNPAKATHHPIGTLLKNVDDGKYWLVVDSGSILDVSGYQHLRRSCAVNVTSSTLACYTVTGFATLALGLDAKAVKFDGLPEVYRLYPGSGLTPTAYAAFVSYDALLSWGYKDADLAQYPAAQKSTVLGGLTNQGTVGFMPGTVVKGKAQSEIAVANQDGVRRPLFNWDVFTALGYDSTCMYEIESSTLDVTAGPRSADLITLAETAECVGSVPHPICTPGATVPCGCEGNKPGTQSCQNDGLSYGSCVCQGGGGSDDDAGAYLCPPGSLIECGCGNNDYAQQVCADDGMSYGPCSCPQPGAGGNGGSAGTGGTSGQGGYGGSASGSGGYSGTGGTSNTGGASGSSSAGGSGGSGGSGPHIVTIKYTGKRYANDLITASSQLNGPLVDLTVFDSLPKDLMAWFDGSTSPNGKVDQNNDYVSDCKTGPQRDMTCTFTVPKGSSLLFQIDLGAYRYWGDASGSSPAPCIAESVVPNMSCTSVVVMGQVELFVDGVPFPFSLLSNNIQDPNWQANGQKCGASHAPYYNGIAVLP